jgi:hypothetical protein
MTSPAGPGEPALGKILNASGAGSHGRSRHSDAASYISSVLLYFKKYEAASEWLYRRWLGAGPQCRPPAAGHSGWQNPCHNSAANIKLCFDVPARMGADAVVVRGGLGRVSRVAPPRIQFVPNSLA